MRLKGFSLVEVLVGMAISVAALGIVIQSSQIVKKNLGSRSYVEAYKEAFATALLIRDLISRSGVMLENLRIPQCLLTFRNSEFGISSVPFGPVALFVPGQMHHSGKSFKSVEMVIVWTSFPLNPSGFIRFRGPMDIEGYSVGSAYFRLNPDGIIPWNFRVRNAFLFRFRDSLIPNAYPPFCQLSSLERDIHHSNGLLIPSHGDSGGVNFFENESVFPSSGNNFSWVYGGSFYNGAPNGSVMKNNFRFAVDNTTGGREFLNDDEPSSTGGSIGHDSYQNFLSYNKQGLYGPSYALLSFHPINVTVLGVDINKTAGFYIMDLFRSSGRRIISPSIVSIQAQYGIVVAPGQLKWYNPPKFVDLMRSPLLKIGKIDAIRFAILARGGYEKGRTSPNPRWMGGPFPMSDFVGELGDRSRWIRWNYAVAEMVVPIRNRYNSIGYLARDPFAMRSLIN